jgi:cephalosporin hydroxylase
LTGGSEWSGSDCRNPGFEDIHALWQIGDWKTICSLELDVLARLKEFPQVLVIAAVASLQLGEKVRAAHLIRRASKAGIPSRYLAEALLSGAENSLGLAAKTIGVEAKSARHLMASQGLGGSGSPSEAAQGARVQLQLEELARRARVNAQKNAGGAPAQLSGKEPLIDLSLPAHSISALKQGIKAEIQADIRSNNPNPYAHNRTLTPALNKSLRDFGAAQLGLKDIKPAYIDYLATKAIQLEKNCVGRLATTVQDAVARQLVAECLVTQDRYVVLEIGALYGISLAILYNHLITRYPSVQVVCLDPFDGYYGQAIDAVLNQPVNDLTFLRNMRLANVPERDHQVIKRYSTDPEAIRAAEHLGIDLLIIDGDHSYEGVKFDFEHYFPYLKPGGYVIHDDYNAKEWPGVQQFVDEDLPRFKDYEHLGSISRTAVGRKRINPNDSPQQSS